jgi:sporulation protein YlmC with PRC-barrel domain
VAREIHFERLIGRAVRNTAGRAIGRIEDIRVVPDGEDYVVSEYLVGPLHPLHQLSEFLGELPTFRALGLGRKSRLRRLHWEWVDISDPERPTLVRQESGDG